MWEAFITAPENAHLLKRYAKSAKEPAALFDNIGEDLGSSKQEVREQAYWALVAAMPELTRIHHEREIRQPGWRDTEGKDQRMANRGIDMLSYLHHKFVVEHYFKIHGKNGKDPRRLINKIMSNWKKDRDKKLRREEPPEDEDMLDIPDPAGSVEDKVREKTAYEEWKRELHAMGIVRRPEEFDLCWTILVDERSFDEAGKRLGIPSKPALRQRLSRGRKTIVADRDALFSYFLCEFQTIRAAKPTSQNIMLMERAKKSILPGDWLQGRAADGKNAFAVRPLTTGFRGAPSHIYHVAIHKDYCVPPPYVNRKYERDTYHTSFAEYFTDAQKREVKLHLDSLEQFCLQHVDRLIDPGGRWFKRYRDALYLLDEGHTQLPGLDGAIAEVCDDYHSLVIRNSCPEPSFIPNPLFSCFWHLRGQTIHAVFPDSTSFSGKISTY